MNQYLSFTAKRGRPKKEVSTVQKTRPTAQNTLHLLLKDKKVNYQQFAAAKFYYGLHSQHLQMIGAPLRIKSCSIINIQTNSGRLMRQDRNPDYYKKLQEVRLLLKQVSPRCEEIVNKIVIDNIESTSLETESVIGSDLQIFKLGLNKIVRYRQKLMTLEYEEGITEVIVLGKN